MWLISIHIPIVRNFENSYFSNYLINDKDGIQIQYGSSDVGVFVPASYGVLKS